MSDTKPVEQHRLGSPSDSWVGRAWIAVALIPVVFLPAMAVGYVAYDLMGYQPENDDAPMWVDLVCAIPSLGVLWIPCAAAVVYGRRAWRVGSRGGVLPAAIGALVGLGFTLLSLVTALD